MARQQRDDNRLVDAVVSGAVFSHESGRHSYWDHSAPGVAAEAYNYRVSQGERVEPSVVAELENGPRREQRKVNELLRMPDDE